eukprot:4067129-Amphidinium_carterae.1
MCIRDSQQRGLVAVTAFALLSAGVGAVGPDARPPWWIINGDTPCSYQNVLPDLLCASQASTTYFAHLLKGILAQMLGKEAGRAVAGSCPSSQNGCCNGF